MPTSTAPEEPAGESARIARAARAALRGVGGAGGGGDTTSRTLRAAKVAEAVLVRAPGGEPAFWLVPLVVGDLACGYARVGLDGRVAQLSQFGGGGADRAAWPPAAFFVQPPVRWLEEIRAKHPGVLLAAPLLSYDGAPAKWAWRIALGDGARVAYVLPSGWYEAPGYEPVRE